MQASATTDRLSASPAPRSRARLRLILAAGVVVALGVAWWVHKRATADAEPFPRDPELQRARQMIFSLDATVDDYAIAERIVKDIAAKRANDPEVLVLMAEVNNWYFLRGFDRSETRLWDMGAHSRRAHQLAPDRPEAIAAMGEYLLARERDLDRAADLLREAIARDPNVPRWYSSLAEVLRYSDFEAGLAVLQDAVRRFPDDALVRYNLARHYRDVHRVEEMERELDAVIEMEPITNALLWKARVRLWGHGDLEGMKRALDRVPAEMRISERAAVNLFVYGSMAREPAEALAILRQLPSTWIEDYDYAGPKALLTAILLELQGNQEEARREYQVSYSELARRRPIPETDTAARTAEIWTLLGLGRHDEARVLYGVNLGRVTRPYRLGLSTSWWFSDIPTTHALGDRGLMLQLLRETAETVEGRRQLQINFRIDPRMASLREDPEIAAILGQP